MKIEIGRTTKPWKVVVYGSEGVGKSTLASQLLNPVFIPVENGIQQLNVARTPVPTTYQEFDQCVELVRKSTYSTIVVDSIDVLEQLIAQHLCAFYQKKAIGDIGSFGAGYTALAAEVFRVIGLLTGTGKNIVLVGHASIRTITNPTGKDFDQYDLRMSKQGASRVKEWADYLLFATYDTTVSDDNKVVWNGERVLWTTYQQGIAAKNRGDFPDKVPLSGRILSALLAASNLETETLIDSIQLAVSKLEASRQSKAAAAVTAAKEDRKRLMAILTKVLMDEGR